MSLATQMRRAAAGAGGEFDPATAVDWLEFFWAEGSNFASLGYDDGDSVNEWPSEVSALTSSGVSGTAPVYTASVAALGGNPAVTFAGAGGPITDSFSDLSQDYSLVVLSLPSTVNFIAKSVLGDGTMEADRRLIEYSTQFTLGAGRFLASDGGSISAGVPYLGVGYFNGASSALEFNGEAKTGNAGTADLTELWIGTAYRGSLPFVGVKGGDVRDDPGWTEFESWVEDHYGVSIA